MDRVLIKFLKHSTPYAQGEVAGFPTERAALYVKHGIGTYCDAKGVASKDPVVVKVPRRRALQLADQAAGRAA